MKNNTYKFFWKSFSPFSNWYLCDFKYKNVDFTSSEQAMMWEKALYFGDMVSADKILKTSDPKIQKALGRSISNFNAERWDVVKFQLVKEINRCKFQQNTKLFVTLKKHQGITLVEASPFDRIWGIGYSEDDALNNIDNWGENLLGKLLTELSNEL